MQTPDRPAAIRYRRRPDVVEAMQWNPADKSMQDVLAWLRSEGMVFKTVGSQLWITLNDDGLTAVVHPGDYVARKTEGRRYFYSEGAVAFEREREVDA